ncbi:MAG TPA: protein kinase [Chthoniobacteraceae bacterium]|nr:protein kinase [Chthoniobacteraceae bacterium]
MPSEARCPRCGAPLEAGAVAGRCPACLLNQGAVADTLTGGGGGAFTPPTVEELAGKFPQLEIIELIGQGGMGAVYKARQTQLDRIVALKILPPGIGNDPAFAERFAREARALAKLNHPNIVTIHDFGHTGGEPGEHKGGEAGGKDGLFYLVMEYVDGITLRRLLTTRRVSPREALAIVPEICDALQFAHDHGIVHRDIKPENILLDRRGRVKVADFGLAKLIVGGADIISAAVASVEIGPEAGAFTEAGKVMGTPQYMAPEQREHPGEVDHRADIYALGVVFYQMLTGQLPGKPIEAPSKKVRLDIRLDEIVLRALEKEPEQRYQQASILKTQVETIASAASAAAVAAVAASAGGSGAKEPPPQNPVATDDPPPRRGARSYIILVRSFIPLAAVFLAFFNPWGGRGWYYFAAACAILAILPGVGFPRRGSRAYGADAWGSPALGIVSLVLLVAGLVGTPLLLAFAPAAAMIFGALTFLPALVFGFASGTTTGRWSALACITLFIASWVIFKEYQSLFVTVQPATMARPPRQTPAPAPDNPVVQQLQQKLDAALKQQTDWQNIGISDNDPKVQAVTTEVKSLKLQIKELEDHPKESPELVAAKADLWRARMSPAKEDKFNTALGRVKQLERQADTPPIPAGQYTYGPAFERVITIRDRGGYNFETGEYVANPVPAGSNSFEEEDWMKQSGVSLTGGFGNMPPVFNFFGRGARSVDDSVWDGDPAGAVVDFVFGEAANQSDTLAWDEGFDQCKTPAALLDASNLLAHAHGKSEGIGGDEHTYLFRTLGGRIGLLQILSTTPDKKGANIRWKLVEDIGAPSPQTLAEAPKLQYFLLRPSDDQGNNNSGPRIIRPGGLPPPIPGQGGNTHNLILSLAFTHPDFTGDARARFQLVNEAGERVYPQKYVDYPWADCGFSDKNGTRTYYMTYPANDYDPGKPVNIRLAYAIGPWELKKEIPADSMEPSEPVAVASGVLLTLDGGFNALDLTFPASSPEEPGYEYKLEAVPKEGKMQAGGQISGGGLTSKTMKLVYQFNGPPSGIKSYQVFARPIKMAEYKNISFVSGGLSYGPEVNGLRAALEVTPQDGNGVRAGQAVSLAYHVRNITTDKEIQVACPSLRQDDYGDPPLIVEDEQGKSLPVDYNRDVMHASPTQRVTLKPGDTATFEGERLVFLPEGTKKPDDNNPAAFVEAGRGVFNIRYKLRLPGLPTADAQAGDWKGELDTTPVTVDIAPQNAAPAATSASYTSTTTVEVKAMAASGAEPQFVSGQIDIIESQPILEAVVGQLGLIDKWSGGLPAKLTVGEACQKLGKMIHVSGVRNTDMIQISATSADSQEAADIANAIASAYVKKRKDDQQQEITNALAMFSAEADALRKTVDQDAAALATIRARDHVDDPHPDTEGAAVKPADAEYEKAKAEYITSKSLLDKATQVYETKKMELQITLAPAVIWDKAVPAQSSSATPAPAPVVIDVVDGQFVVQGGTVSAGDLDAKLSVLGKAHPGQGVILSADNKTDYGSIAMLLDLCQKAGIINVAFPPSSSGPGAGGEGATKVAVLGQVAAVGMVGVGQGEKLMLSEAIAKSGGAKDDADLRKVKLTRKNPGGDAEVKIVDVDAIIKAAAPDVELQDGDLIYVPPKTVNFGP